MTTFEESAQELVETTSRLVGGRTINIMNTEGTIIASTERERIGTRHEGACEVIRTGRPVAIRKNQLKCYPGAKEGYNMPIRSGGVVIGVVGIFGEPQEIADVAHLLEVYVIKFFQLEAMTKERLAEGELRGSLLRLLLALSDKDLERVQALINALQLHLQPPFRVAVITAGDQGERILGELPERLREEQILHSASDVWGIVSGQLVIIKSAVAEMDTRERQMLERALRGGLVRYDISLGSRCTRLEELALSYREASTLASCGDGWYRDIERMADRSAYLLYRTVSKEDMFLSGLHRKLQEVLDDNEMETLLASAACYYEENHSVTQAAERLFIHKNTLQYRVRRVLSLLELENCPVFQQEYIIRLLLLYHEKEICSKGVQS